jgi:hypothetical protein
MNLQPFIKAYQAHQYMLLGALLVGGLVAFSKQGWFSAWLDKKLTPRLIPYYALLVSLLTVGSTDIVSGKSWQQAAQDVLGALVLAIAGHQLVIESLFSGREIVPQKTVEPTK